MLGDLLLDFDGVDAGLGRRGMTKGVEEGIQRGAVALHLDPHGVGFVAHPAGQPAAPGRLVDERAKADSLHDAPHGDCQAAHGQSGWRRRRIHGTNRRSCNWRRQLDPLILKCTSGRRAG